MKPFHSIESLRHLCEGVNGYCEATGRDIKPVVKFRGTVKLHGTNAGVHVLSHGVVTAQGRNSVLTIQQDNFGFAHFVHGREAVFNNMHHALTNHQLINHELTFYGEWCGQGIQKGVGVAQVAKHFVVFDVYDHTDERWLDIVDEVKFSDELLATLNHFDVWLITQVPTYEVTIDFNDPIPAAELISQYTLQVEAECPWAKFRGVEGVGEGIVWKAVNYPVNLYFKSKGEKHKKGGPKQHVAVDPEKVKGISELVDLILPEWRLEQGIQFLRENNLPVANTSTGQYLKWIAQDILKEESDRIAANPYPWKEIQGTVMVRAREYFLHQLNVMAGLAPAEASA